MDPARIIGAALGVTLLLCIPALWLYMKYETRRNRKED